MASAIPESTSLLRFVGNAELNEKEDQKRQNEKVQAKPEIRGLAAYLQKRWESAKMAKYPIDDRLLKCFRAREGIYSPRELQEIRMFGGSETYMLLTNIKCRTIEAWMKDVMLPAGEKPWSVLPTPVPSLPGEAEESIGAQIAAEISDVIDQFGQEVVTLKMIDDRMRELRNEIKAQAGKEAEEEAAQIEDKVEDEFQQGAFYTALGKFLKDFSTYPAGILKGPTFKKKRSLAWEGGKAVVREVVYRSYDCSSPFDIYPSPNARTLQEGYLFERIRFTPAQLASLKGVDGYSEAAIDDCLENYRFGRLKQWLYTDQERARLEGRPLELIEFDDIIDALVFWGDIPPNQLIMWGMDQDIFADMFTPVPCTAILVGNQVIMAVINYDPLGRRPYYHASFEGANNSIWGMAPPELVEDCQRACNATARGLINNVGLASGPQVEVQWDRLQPNEDANKIWPWKIWKTKSDLLGHNRNAINFYQPELVARELIEVFTFFFGQAGEQLGVPAYEAGVGGQASGAGQTAHGLSMLMSAASKVMKDAIYAVDTNIIKPVVQSTTDELILAEEVEYTGDINIMARASEYLIVAEQLQARRAEFLAVTNNPIDMAIIGHKRRAKILRENAKSLKLQGDVVPKDDELVAAMQENMQLMAGMGGGGGGAPGGGGGPGGPVPQGTASENPMMSQLDQLSQL